MTSENLLHASVDLELVGDNALYFPRYVLCPSAFQGLLELSSYCFLSSHKMVHVDWEFFQLNLKLFNGLGAELFSSFEVDQHPLLDDREFKERCLGYKLIVQLDKKLDGVNERLFPKHGIVLQN